VTSMNYMFQRCDVLSSLNLSNWCVTNITSEPQTFTDWAPFADTPSNLPIWGTCPTT